MLTPPPPGRLETVNLKAWGRGAWGALAGRKTKDVQYSRVMNARAHILLETIVVSPEDAVAAAAGGAERFELCSALALGGLTPSMGTLEAVKAATNVPVMCMIRPREGGMSYTRGEFQAMLRDAELALQHGADGLVFGFLTDAGEVDVRRCRRMMRVISDSGRSGIEAVFHRAFDVASRPRTALEQLIQLGVTRILTSGRAPTALAGADQIRRTAEQADGRIEMLAGGGINLENLAQVIQQSGVDQVHLYLTETRIDSSTSANPAISFAAHPPTSEREYRAVDKEMVARAAEVCRSKGW